jgi:predicted phosphoadenosine phosphosulfate sulfurtransferase
MAKSNQLKSHRITMIKQQLDSLCLEFTGLKALVRQIEKEIRDKNHLDNRFIECESKINNMKDYIQKELF